MNFYEIRRNAIEQMPFAAECLMNMTPIAHDESPGIVADDKWNIYYNPKMMEDDSNCDDFTDALCLEVIKLFQGHSERIRNLIPAGTEYSRYYQSIACTCSDALARALLHNDLGYVKDLNGKNYLRCPSLEAIYRELCEELGPPPMMPGQSQQSQDEGGQGQQSQQGSSNGQQQDENNQQDTGPAPGCLDPDKLGSSSDGQARPWEKNQQNNSPASKETRDQKQQSSSQESTSPQPSQISTMPSQQSVSGAIKSAVKKLAESHPGRREGYHETLLEQWAQEELSLHVEKRSLDSLIREYTETTRGSELRRYDGRNRRQAQMSSYNNCQMVLPTDCKPKLNIMIVLDCSGSMCRSRSRYALQKIAKILERHNISQCSGFYTGDTYPEYRGILTPERARKIDIPSDGGTDMARVCYKAYQAELARGGSPNVLLCVTDGETHWRQDMIDDIKIPVAVQLAFDFSEEWTNLEEAMYTAQTTQHIISMYPLAEGMTLLEDL